MVLSVAANPFLDVIWKIRNVIFLDLNIYQWMNDPNKITFFDSIFCENTQAV